MAETGQMFGGATVERARRRSAHGALIATRARAAAAAGCRWLMVETEPRADEGDFASARNLTRLGLVPAYRRQVWTVTIPLP
jgi:hypothetical protein